MFSKLPTIFWIENDAGQYVILENITKEETLELCMKFLYNHNYKIIFNNGEHVKAENRVYYSSFFEIGVKQIGNNVNIHLQEYGELFHTTPLSDSIMYLEIMKSIHRRLKREIPKEMRDQLSKYK